MLTRRIGGFTIIFYQFPLLKGPPIFIIYYARNVTGDPAGYVPRVFYLSDLFLREECPAPECPFPLPVTHFPLSVTRPERVKISGRVPIRKSEE